MYPEHLVTPMRKELTNEGFVEITSAEQARQILDHLTGTALVVINSVCGCAAGSARPGVLMSLENAVKKPDFLFTVFAGVDKEATEAVRKYLEPYPPSSPSIALLKNGEVVHMVERHQIEGRPAELIARHLQQVYERLC